MAETPEQKDLRIKTGVCKRTLKDLDYYHAEISEHKVKIAGMEEEGKDANDIDKRVRPSVCVCVLLCALLTLCCSCSTPVRQIRPVCICVSPDACVLTVLGLRPSASFVPYRSPTASLRSIAGMAPRPFFCAARHDGPYRYGRSLSLSPRPPHTHPHASIANALSVRC